MIDFYFILNGSMVNIRNLLCRNVTPKAPFSN